jgi:hypothetical protein
VQQKFCSATSNLYICNPFGGLAQLVERLHGMQKVSGSTPLTSTNQSNPAVAGFFICIGKVMSMGIFRQLAEYLYIKKRDLNEPRTQWMKYMHGMNRLSLLMFIAAVLFILFKMLIWPLIKGK